MKNRCLIFFFLLVFTLGLLCLLEPAGSGVVAPMYDPTAIHVGSGALEIADVNMLNTPADEDVLTYETGSGGGFEGMTIAELLATNPTFARVATTDDILMQKTSAQGYIYAYDTATDKYIRMHHDGTDGYLMSLSGDLILQPSGAGKIVATGGIKPSADGQSLGISGTEFGTAYINQILSDTGAVDFGDENLTTTGTLGAGAITVTGKTGDDVYIFKDAGSGIRIRSDTLTTQWWAGDDGPAYFGTISNDDLHIQTNNNNRITIKSGAGSGNVGIGTTTPDEKLEVVGTSLISGSTAILDITSTDTATGEGHSRLRFNSAGKAGQTANTKNFAFTNSNAAAGQDENTWILQSRNDDGTFKADLMGILHSGSIGMGTPTPLEKLDVYGNLKIGDSIVSYMRIRRSTTHMVMEHIGATGNIYIRPFVSGDTSGDLVLNDLGGNVTVGTSSAGTGADGCLTIKAGTHPTTVTADCATFFVEDVVAGTAEMRVIDEGEAETTLSPHNFSLFEPDENYVYPWSYYSKNDIIGKEINVDMYGAIEAIEELSGKKFIYTQDIPKDKKTWEEKQTFLQKQKQLQEEIEITLAEALEEYEITEPNIIGYETGYRFDPNTGKIEEIQGPIFGELPTGKFAKRLKAGSWLDEKTGKLYRKKQLDEIVIDPKKFTQLPKWMKKLNEQ